MLIFIGAFPTDKNIKDGMIQRINSIDKLVKDRKRIYLEISYRKNIKKSIENYNNISVYKVNYFIHRRIIKKILQSSRDIYIHSIYNYAKVRMFRRMLNDKNITLDFHGVVPEELEYNGMKLKSRYFEKIEKEICKLANKIIFVTNSMDKYIRQKYRNIEFKSEIYPIFAENIEKNNECTSYELREQLNIKNDDVVIIYSGNCQKWQNIDCMLDLIRKCTNPKYKFIILTGELEVMNVKIDKMKLRDKVILKSVLPNELKEYYNIANYGFVLRDDHILNKVACPTKLIEYMNYGIIPIVKCDKIGDFHEFGYKFISLNDFDNELPNIKSNENIEIIKNLIDKKNNIKIFSE